MIDDTQCLTQLRTEVEQLRHEVVKWRWACLMFSCVLVLFLLSGQTRSTKSQVTKDVVRTKRLELVDSAGVTRAELGVTSDGSARLSIRACDESAAAYMGVSATGTPSVALIDSEGSAYTELTLADGLPRIILRGQSSKPRISFGVQKDGRAGIDVLDAEGTIRNSICAAARGDRNGVTVFDRCGKVRAALVIGFDGVPNLALYDASEHNRLTVSTDKDGAAPTINLFDPQAVGRLSLGLTVQGAPVLSFLDSRQKVRAGMGLREAGSPFMEFRDEDGKRSWSGP